MKILSFGEVLWDVYPNEKFIGGAPFNFAAHLAKHGEDAFLLSAVGKDDLGALTLEAVESLCVGTNYIRVLENKPTGRCDVTLDENAVPTYDLKSDVTYDFIDCGGINENFDVLYFGTLALRSNYNYDSLKGLIADNSFNEIFCDVNIRAPHYSEASLKLCFENATIIKISLEELETVCSLLKISAADYKAFAKAVAKTYSNLKVVIITLGEDGAYCYDSRSGCEYAGAAQKVNVVSTVGAGDSFSAAFLHKFMRNCDIDICLEHASKVSGFVVANKGAVPQYSLSDF